MTRKMKDSGIERIGEIPEEWEIIPAKYVFTNKKIIVGTLEEKYERLALTLNGVVKRSKIDSEGLQPINFYTYQILQENELVFKLIDLQNVNTSRVGLAPFSGIVSPAYIILAIKDNRKDHQKFYYYWFMSMYYRQIFNKLGDAGVRSNINSTELLNIIVPRTDFENQTRIVNYLDRKCHSINHIQELVTQEIQILEEYKKSLITEAVTKGLDPDVEMKDSGIEWIGEIPKHWEIGKTLFYLEMPITDGPHITPTLYDTGIPFVSAEAVSAGNGRINFNNIRGYVSYEFYLECCKKYIPQINDIYMIKSGATTGKVAIVDTDTKFTIRSPLAVFRSKKSKIIPKFLFYVLQSNYYLTQVELFWNYGTQQNIGMRTLENLKICSPKILEQQKIVSYLDEKCKIIDDAIKKKNQQVEILEDYKKSLIYEYVTGKKEVPHA